MPVSLYAFGCPDSSGAIYLPNQASAHTAHATLNSSSTEPPVKAACMPWFDLSTNTFKVRDTSNITWIPIWRLTNAGVEPLYRGQPLGPLAALVPTPGSSGYIWANADGTVVVQDVSTPDIPVFSVRTAGMVPGPTALQSDFRSRLSADGAWRDGPQIFGSREFAGAQDYSIGGLARSEVYRVAVWANLSNAQTLVLQVGSSGSPKQTGYSAIASRSSSSPTAATFGFELWDKYDEVRQMIIVGDLVSVGGNFWSWSGSGGPAVGGADGDISRGLVQLSGPLDFIRVLPSGNPRGTFNARASMNSGSIKVFA